MLKANSTSRFLTYAAAILVMLAACGCTSYRWFRGNTHSHSWWSDGDSPPEIVVSRYKDAGYNFLVLSDHDTIADHERWFFPRDERRARCVDVYEACYGPDGIEKRERNGNTEYRLKTLDELRPRYDEPGQFLLIPGLEITVRAPLNVHANGINLVEVIPPRSTGDVPGTMQITMDAVLAQQQRTGQPMLAHLNHPNWQWATRPEDYMKLRGKLLFEVYNGGGVRNYGDELHVSTERLWDIVLTERLGQLGLPTMYGVATDDAHTYAQPKKGKGNTAREWVGKDSTGRGWVMVWAKRLTPTDIVLAMERGDFYASTGVILDHVRFHNNTLEINIHARNGVSYRTQFIGTRIGYDRTVMTRPTVTTRPGDPKNYFFRNYSDSIGEVLAEQVGTRAAYQMTGDEIYVRAKVISAAKHPNPHAKGDVEVAWIQPVQPTDVQRRIR